MIIDEYFTDSELACKCGCGKMPELNSIERLYALRLLWRKPIKINSAARCPSHNLAQGGSVGSAHLVGAFDIAIPPKYEHSFIWLAMQCGFTGIGIKNNVFVHIDCVHEEPTVWTY